ncbi:Protein LURP-one-related 3 [Camellia lanceoleosa]|uniref:Protein LURP-one-related 3 n=1 Tax=Camellia lanceoleosa TaxID=1840588 RepID=A0ACC0FLS4_9ERIC|nr:Protein LURP-one-related 3 [Camellia lanceoleosa]
MTSTRETFTIWMKSLVFHGNGCTVFNSNGKIVYRIDNYDKKSSNEVYLMDLQGKVLFSIRRKKLSFLGHWDIYKWSGSKMNKLEKPWYQARTHSNFLGREMACETKAIIFRCCGGSLVVEPQTDHSLVMALVTVYGLMTDKI